MGSFSPFTLSDEAHAPKSHTDFRNRMFNVCRTNSHSRAIISNAIYVRRKCGQKWDEMLSDYGHRRWCVCVNEWMSECRAIVFILSASNNHLSRHFSGHNKMIGKHVLFISIIHLFISIIMLAKWLCFPCNHTQYHFDFGTLMCCSVTCTHTHISI